MSKKWLLTTMACLMFGGIGATSLGGWILLKAGKRSGHSLIFIPPHRSVFDVATHLRQEGIIENPYFFSAVYYGCYHRKKVKAGDYRIPHNASLWDIAKIIGIGKTALRKLTIPEGLSVIQILNLVQQTQGLSGNIKNLPKEGSLLPETYFFSYGDDRQKLIDRMEKDMNKLLQKLWREASHRSLPTPEDALVLASIIEKETSFGEERKKIAAVFLNRLKKGMRLQSDPTVVYALTRGGSSLTRPLTCKDLKLTSPYNTYREGGLPPSPIACPGRAAIEAVLEPAQTNDLYFVANEKGTHSFSKSFEEHKVHVKKLRAHRTQLSKNAPIQ